MKRTLVTAVTLAVGTVALPSLALAVDNQPSQGEHSTGRNDAGFGGGPHCHLLAVENANGHFTFVQVFPSHAGHVHSGLGEAGPFIADANCDGQPPPPTP